MSATPLKLAQLQVLVVPHTHWDREWYYSAARFQTRLVSLVDALLAGPESVRVDAAVPFLLDGQMVVIDDYLTVRPERAADVAVALKSGALEAGPWYVLADNLIPSGEAIIRNLEAGRRRVRRFGATTPAVAYCPDTFGHPGALPQIARGFGCHVAVVWRGYGGATFPSGDTAWWESVDGSRVLLHHLPPDGYEFGSALPLNAADASQRWQHMAPVLMERNSTGVALLLAGADHHAAQPDIAVAVALLSDAASQHQGTVRLCGLGQAAGVLLQTAMSGAAVLPTVRGELRDSYGYTWTLQGTLATRAHQKRANAQLERAMLHDVEPWGVLAWLHAHPTFHNISEFGATTLAQLPALTQHTWETLLRTHPHDTLCGCASDDVADAMTARQRRVKSVIPELRHVALAGALQHDVVRARAGACPATGVGEQLLVVRNRCGRRRGGVAEVTIVETLAHVPVGPGSGRSVKSLSEISQAHPRVTPVVSDCVVQTISTRETFARRESPQHYPDNDRVRKHRVLAWLPPMPAYGICVMHPRTRVRHTAAPLGPVVLTTHSETVRLSNDLVSLAVSQNGVDIAIGDRSLTNALRLITTRDHGDSYTPSLRGAPEPLGIAKIDVGLQGPLRASIKVHWQWQQERERIRVVTELSLTAGSPVVTCMVRGKNNRRNHRLQLIWCTDISHGAVVADAALGPVVRETLQTLSAAVPFEQPPTTMPLHRWLTVHNASQSATLMSDGLAEGEWVSRAEDMANSGHPVSNGELRVSLLRAIGSLSRADIPERPGHAGWPVEIPKAQCIGPFHARVGLLLDGAWSDTTHTNIRDAADDFLLPLTGETWRDLQTTTRELHGPELVGEGLHVSTVHVHERGESIVLRALNANRTAGHGHWVLPTIGPLQARLCRLDGTPESSWVEFAEILPFQIGAREVVTHEVRRPPDYG